MTTLFSYKPHHSFVKFSLPLYQKLFDHELTLEETKWLRTSGYFCTKCGLAGSGGTSHCPSSLAISMSEELIKGVVDFEDGYWKFIKKQHSH